MLQLLVHLQGPRPPQDLCCSPDPHLQGTRQCAASKLPPRGSVLSVALGDAGQAPALHKSHYLLPGPIAVTCPTPAGAGYGGPQLRSLPVPDVVPGGDQAPQPVSSYQAGPASPGASSPAGSRARRLTSLDMHPDLPEPQPPASQQRQSRGALQPDHGPPAISAQDSSSAAWQLQADEGQLRGSEQAVLQGPHAGQDEAQSGYHAAPVSDAVLAQQGVPGRASRTGEGPHEAAAVQNSIGGYSAALPAAPAEAPQPGTVGPPASRVVGGPSGQKPQGLSASSSQGIASLGQRAGRPHSARTPSREGGPGSGEHSCGTIAWDSSLLVHAHGQGSAPGRGSGGMRQGLCGLDHGAVRVLGSPQTLSSTCRALLSWGRKVYGCRPLLCSSFCGLHRPCSYRNSSPVQGRRRHSVPGQQAPPATGSQQRGGQPLQLPWSARGTWMPTAATWPWLPPASQRAVQSTDPQQAGLHVPRLLCQVGPGGP